MNWKPTKKGEVLQGFLTLKRPREGDRSAYYQITDSNNELHIVWGSAVLDDRMQTVEIGEEVKITFNGTKPSSKGKHPMKLFEVMHRKNPNDVVKVTEEMAEVLKNA